MCGRQSIQNIWFSGLVATAQFFAECVPLQKRVRIVVDYDPQSASASITYYRAKDEPETVE